MWSWVKRGILPPPRMFGGLSGWPASEIAAWIASRERGLRSLSPELVGRQSEARRLRREGMEAERQAREAAAAERAERKRTRRPKAA